MRNLIDEALKDLDLGLGDQDRDRIVAAVLTTVRVPIGPALLAAMQSTTPGGRSSFLDILEYDNRGEEDFQTAFAAVIDHVIAQPPR